MQEIVLRPLLILDLDETLIHGSEESLGRACDLRFDRFYVYFRPGLETFLNVIASNYELAVWSSATSGYVEEIVRALPAGPLDLRFVWSRDRCTRRFDPTLHDEYFLKDLKKVKRLGFDLARVLILEDEPRKVWRHYGNAIYLRPYLGAEADDELPRLALYLEKIVDETDFRVMEKRFWRER